MQPHPHYALTNEFIERRKLHCHEAENWVTLTDAEDFMQATRQLSYHKDTGQIYLLKCDEDETVFAGYVPNEEALEQVIAYTRW